MTSSLTARSRIHYSHQRFTETEERCSPRPTLQRNDNQRRWHRLALPDSKQGYPNANCIGCVKATSGTTSASNTPKSSWSVTQSRELSRRQTRPRQQRTHLPRRTRPQNPGTPHEKPRLTNAAYSVKSCSSGTPVITTPSALAGADGTKNGGYYPPSVDNFR